MTWYNYGHHPNFSLILVSDVSYESRNTIALDLSNKNVEFITSLSYKQFQNNPLITIQDIIPYVGRIKRLSTDNQSYSVPLITDLFKFLIRDYDYTMHKVANHLAIDRTQNP